MKREEIEKAAKKYANENAYIPSDGYAENNMIEMKESFGKTFKDGAEWRINSVWHDAEEQPKDWNETCLVELKSGGSSFCLLSNFDHAGGFSCMDGIHNKNIHVIKWTYLKDLIPNVE